jgi:hypothetical protein
MVKTHPRQPPGGPSTDRVDLPEHKAGYALRDLARLIATCAGHGLKIGLYAERLLDDPLPWTRMRAVCRLLGLVRRYGPDPVGRATEHTTPVLPTAAGANTARFARQPTEFATARTSSASEGTSPATVGSLEGPPSPRVGPPR